MTEVHKNESSGDQFLNKFKVSVDAEVCLLYCCNA